MDIVKNRSCFKNRKPPGRPMLRTFRGPGTGPATHPRVTSFNDCSPNPGPRDPDPAFRIPLSGGWWVPDFHISHYAHLCFNHISDN
jgi:hypothetical protein